MKSISEQLRDKIRLERIFRPEVERIFNSIARDFRVSVAVTEMPPLIADYKPLWEVALKNHYRRVQTAFTGAVKQPADDLLLKVFLDWRNRHAPPQAQRIIETTRVNMNEALQLAREGTVVTGEVLAAREMAAQSFAILKKKFKSRTQTLINTETQAAAETAKFQEAEVNSGVTPGSRQDSDTTKQWTTVGDRHVRDIHREANGQIRKLNEPYLVAGEYLMHPGDATLGASLGNLANCLHPDSIVDFASPLKLMRRWYVGKMVTIKTHSGHEITVTPNHPILSESGFIRAGKIKEGFGIVCGGNDKWGRLDLDVENVKPTIEKIFNSSDFGIFKVRSSSGVVDFHGDISDKGVDIIASDRCLLNARKIFRHDPFGEIIFTDSHFRMRDKSIEGSFMEVFIRFIFEMSITDLITSFMGSFNLIFSLLLRHLTPFEFFSIASATGFHSIDFQNSINCGSLNTNGFMDFINRESVIEKFNDLFKMDFIVPDKFTTNTISKGTSYISDGIIDSTLTDIKSIFDFAKGHSINIGLSDVINIRHFDYSGYVYNLEDEKSYYICNGILNHNCRCISTYKFYK